MIYTLTWREVAVLFRKVEKYSSWIKNSLYSFIHTIIPCCKNHPLLLCFVLACSKTLECDVTPPTKSNIYLSMPDSSTFIYSPWPSDIILCTKVQSILSTASCLMAVSTLPDDHHSKFENAIFLPNFKVNGAWASFLR